ncbi:hypothetical protein [Acaryochloris marina]|uniref:SGNH hydrolase-type esterase domain-containing protein n=1 Tax=Acaryochloris marina (strain MBIC 11017) TaxID=329726 RepID=B0C2Q4_ACAM1|nr:hypothetical protein [Acaryochloris marina]ABW30942.1 hypothetical protein AM1_6010 [Acaryochloris marina MBIC11017]BDM79672.1 hypothetical protein AM10699_25400 [Acaryochloris marina MBIC10699]
MNKFLLKLFKFASLQFLILAAIAFYYIQTHDQLAQKQYLAATIDKHALLKRQAKPRIIFVGGSNVAFGINSNFISSQLNHQPVNMGLHAALGLEYTLNEVEEKLASGDVVVVSLEYENFSNHLPDIPERLFNTIDNRFQNIKFVPYYYAPVMLDKGQLYLGGVIRNVISTLTGTYELDKTYKRVNFSPVGDMMANTGTPRDISKIKGTLEVTDSSIQTALRIIQEFDQVAKDKGAQVYFSYPPLAENVYKDNSEAIGEISAALKDSSELDFIDTSKEMALQVNYFFDSEYHLNQAGALFRAKHIVNRLSKKL